MSFASDKQFDVFLAYWGDTNRGSQNAAKNLYDSLNGLAIGIERYLKVYFHPETNHFGRFDETPMIVARTPLFLLVATNDIPRDHKTGQLLSRREDGTLKNLYEEVRSFNSTMFREIGGEEAAKVFIPDGFSPKEAERLHVVFSGTIALMNLEDTKRWIIDFFHGSYIERWYIRNKSMSEAEFEAGAWIPEAEQHWHDFKPEVVGRSLLIYYLLKYGNGLTSYLGRIETIKNELISLGVHDKKTKDVMDSVNRILNRSEK